MKLETAKRKLSDIPFFNKNDLRFYEDNESNLNLNIKYWLNSGKIKSLKKGWYFFPDKYELRGDKNLVLEMVANEMVKPSYLSADYVLSKFGVLTEAVFSLTSMTVKSKRSIENDLGAFRYYPISKKLFKGYGAKSREDRLIFEADLSKALFDFLYIRFYREKQANENNLENLRIDWGSVSKEDFLKSEKYLKDANSKNIKKLYELIKKKYYVA